MKKFLSLLLALTLVLSLVVVPARAAASGSAQIDVTGKSGTTAKPGDTLSFALSHFSVTGDSDGTASDYVVSELVWKVNGRVSDGTYLVQNSDNTLTVSYTAKLTYTATPDTENPTPVTNKTVQIGDETTVNVTPFSTSDITVKVKGHTATISGNTANVTLVRGATIAEDDIIVTVPSGLSYEKNYTSAGNALAITLKRNNVDVATFNLTISVTPASATISTTPNSATTIRGGQTLSLAAEYTGSSSGNVTYAWTAKDSNDNNAGDFTNGKTASATWKAPEVTAETVYTIKCAATEDDVKTESTGFQVTVTKDTYAIRANSYTKTVAPGNSRALSFSFTDSTISGRDKEVALNSSEVKWSVSGTGLSDSNLSINSNADDAKLKNKRAILTIPANCTAASCVVTAVVTKADKTYTVTYPITISGLSATLPTSVENGSSITLYTKSSDRHEDANLALVAQKVLRDKVSEDLRVTEATIKEARSTTASVTGGTISKLNSSKGTYTFTADRSSLTPAEMTIVATAGGSQYEIKLTIPVTPIMGTNFESVTADPVSSTATTTSYRVYFPTTYTNYYVVNTSGSTPGSWSSSMVSGKGYNYNTPYPLSASNFNNANGTCTLYVIAKDGVNGNYYGGQMTVSLTNYDIKYSVVAGKDVTFSQKDFDSFVKEYAKNRGDWTTASRKDYPYVEFDHAELSTIPTAKTEGTLYYKGSEVTASSNRKAEYADLDRMTFEAASKPTRDTVTLRFSLVCKKYSSASDKGSTVTYPVNVVISIVKEDITYTVGIDDSAFVKVSDFVNFLQDAKTSYRKSTLDYVKFDVSGKNVSSYAYGGLYRSYSSYSTGKLADSTDKFYYEPSRTQYDLADVAYHTTRWAEAGKTVYIPFTVYGTKGEEASGTMAITIAQTMNFIDVKASDFFYEPVKWAVNNKITNGTSSTTFSPYKNCNRAEIVTFLWRAAGSPEPTVTRNPFKDVNAVTHSSYYKAILWASQKGITAGTTATTFSPYQECTRSQIVTFLYRYAGKPSGYYTNPFKDVSSVNEASYYNAILWAVGKGITQGTSTTTFSPYASCTRGEAVTFLYRYVNGVK